MTKRLPTYLLTLALAAMAALTGCTPDEGSGLAGKLMFQDRPLAAAQVEVYLKADKDRSVQPFAVGATDAEGRYRVELPAGRYYVIGKKRETGGDGRTRMLMAESPANPHSVDGGTAQVAAFNLREMGREGLAAADASTGVAGRVTFNGEPAGRTFVYVYTETGAGLVGPSYGEAVQTDHEGRFTVNLPAGRYQLVARRRADGGRTGMLAPGDLNAAYPGNPVEVRAGEMLPLGEFPLAGIDAAVNARRQAEGVFAKTDTLLTGRVLDGEGEPVRGVYVIAYLDSRMVGKPAHMAAPTGADGAFTLYLSGGGTYYVGARSAIGGPLEPGEWVGTFDGRPDHGVEIARGARGDLGQIRVREFW